MKSRHAFGVALVVALTITLGAHLLMFPGPVPDFVRATRVALLAAALPYATIVKRLASVLALLVPLAF